MTMPRKKVLMFVLNELIYDARVLKSAQSLSDRYDLLLIGVWRRKFELNQDLERGKWPFQMAWVDLGRISKAPRNIFGHVLRYSRVFHRIQSMGIEFQPDLVHAHEASSLPIARAIQKATKARLIYDAHELYRDKAGLSPVLRKSLGWMETRILKSCDGIIACNVPRAEIMRDEYGAPFLPTVIPNMTRHRTFTPSTILQDMTGSSKLGISKLVLYQGAIIPGRGLEILPRALRRLPDNFGIVIMGGGEPDYINGLGDLANGLEVADRFFVLPPVSQSKLFPYTCSADVGIVIYQNTCRNNYYCAPNKLYEYSAAGTPMVGADLPTIRQFIDGESVGSLFDPESHEDLARAILEVCDKETFSRSFETCLEIAEKFSWESVSEIELHALYNDILEMRTQPNAGNERKR